MKVLSELISSRSLFPPRICRIPFAFARSRAAVQCRFRGCTRCALRSSHDAGFLPDKAPGFGWKTRWSSGGIFFSSVIMEYNKVKCETAAYEPAFLSMQRVRIGNASCSSAERANKQLGIEGRRWHVECFFSFEYSCERFRRLGTS